jgi:hypothetical protein
MHRKTFQGWKPECIQRSRGSLNVNAPGQAGEKFFLPYYDCASLRLGNGYHRALVEH